MEAASAFHDAAMALQGKDNGGVGFHTEYGQKYYAAFVVDPDGNRIPMASRVTVFESRLNDREIPQYRFEVQNP